MLTGISGSNTVLIAATMASWSASVRAASTGPNAGGAAAVVEGAASASTFRSGGGRTDAIGSVAEPDAAAGDTAAAAGDPTGASTSAAGVERPVSLFRIENIGL